jgi:hypothetical protein
VARVFTPPEMLAVYILGFSPGGCFSSGSGLFRNVPDRPGRKTIVLPTSSSIACPAPSST